MDTQWPVLLALGGVATVIATTWRSIVSAFSTVKGLFIDKVIITSTEQAEAIVGLLRSKHKLTRLGFRFICCRSNYVSARSRFENIGMERFYGRFLAKYGKVRFCITVKENHGSGMGKGELPSPTSYSSYECLVITFLRGSLDIDKLVVEASALSTATVHGDDSTSQNRFYVTTFFGKGTTMSMEGQSNNSDEATPQRMVTGHTDTSLFRLASLGSTRLIGDHTLASLRASSYLGEGDPFDVHPYPAEVSKAVDDLGRWLKSREWFSKRSISWRLGWLLTGLPGTGKSSFITACAVKYGIPIYCFDLASMNNKELRNYFEEVEISAPAFAVFEDIDRVFDGSTNVARPKGGGVTLDGLLNTIQGVRPGGGVVTVLTCNDPTRIDAALGCPKDAVPYGEFLVSNSTRPGRVDKIISFGFIKEAERKILASKIIGEDLGVDIEKLVKESEQITASAFSDKCVQLALAAYHKQKLI